MTTGRTDGHVKGICVSCGELPASAGPDGRAGTVRLVDDEDVELARWAISAPTHFHAWCAELVAGHAEGQIVSGDRTVVAGRARDELVWALYEPWLNDEQTLVGLFSIDEDVVLSLTGAIA